MSEQSAVMTIDGPGGAGKGTIAREIARTLGWHLLDSGAIYRLLALASLRDAIDPADSARLAERARALDIDFVVEGDHAGSALLEGELVGEAIRDEACGERASVVAADPRVREALKARQQAFRQPPGLVADGRDMGTVIFPDAPVKIFLTASVEERARRRHKQLMEQGVAANLSILMQELQARDARDSERQTAPLKPAEDAITIDTTDKSIDTVVRIVMERVDACLR